MKIDVVLNPPEIDLLPQRDLCDSVAIVFDVLRATSTMLTALANGAKEIFPVRTIEEAFALKQTIGDALLGGERQGDRIDGFDLGNSPLEYHANVRDRRIITTTTNGTVALRACESARAVLPGALLNLSGLAGYIRSTVAAEIVLVCAGTRRETALEDIIGAGILCAQFPDATLTDSAKIALATYKEAAGDLFAALCSARNGRALCAKNRDEEVRWCATVDRFDLVAEMKAGVIRVRD